MSAHLKAQTSRPTIAELKQSLQDISYSKTQHLSGPAPLWTLDQVSIPKNGLIEVSGNSRLEWIARFLSRHPEIRVAWIEKELSIFPPALAQRQVDIEQLCFIEAKDHWEWSLLTALKGQCFDLVITSFLWAVCFKSSGRANPERLIQRLRIFSEKANCAVFLLTDSKMSSAFPTPWALSVRLSATHSDQFSFDPNYSGSRLVTRILRSKIPTVENCSDRRESL